MTLRTAIAHQVTLIEALTPDTKDVGLQSFAHEPEANSERRPLGRGFWFSSEGQEHEAPYTIGRDRMVSFIVLHLFYPSMGSDEELMFILAEDYKLIARALIRDAGASETTTIVGVGDLHSENVSLLPSTHVEVDGGIEMQIRYPLFHFEDA